MGHIPRPRAKWEGPGPSHRPLGCCPHALQLVSSWPHIRGHQGAPDQGPWRGRHPSLIPSVFNGHVQALVLLLGPPHDAHSPGTVTDTSMKGGHGGGARTRAEASLRLLPGERLPGWVSTPRDTRSYPWGQPCTALAEGQGGPQPGAARPEPPAAGRTATPHARALASRPSLGVSCSPAHQVPCAPGWLPVLATCVLVYLRPYLPEHPCRGL